MTVKLSEAFSPGRAITTGWNGLQRAPIPVLIGALLLLLSDVRCGQDIEFDDIPSLEVGAILGALVLITSFLSLLRFLMGAFVRPGYLRMGAAALRGEAPAFETIFTGGDRFWDMLLWGLLRGAVLFGAGLVLCIPLFPSILVGGLAGANDNEFIGILAIVMASFYLLFIALPAFLYVEMGTYFGSYLVALEEKGPLEALKESWRLSSGNRLWLVLYRALMGIFVGLGLFFFFLGVIVTWGVAELGTLRAFLEWRASNGGDVRKYLLPPMPPTPPSPVPEGAPLRPSVPPVGTAAAPLVPPTAEAQDPDSSGSDQGEPGAGVSEGSESGPVEAESDALKSDPPESGDSTSDSPRGKSPRGESPTSQGPESTSS